MRIFCLGFLWVALLAGGCRPQAPGAGSTTMPSAVELQARFEAASAITYSGDRDAALAVVARDAARAGVAAVVKEAVGRIQFTSARDAAAAECAPLLAAAGQAAAANEVARMIAFTGTRDLTLKKLAAGGR